MYVIFVEFVRPLEEVDRVAPAHKAWLETLRAAGTLLASGRRNPRTGGVILAAAPSREAIDRLIEADPFHVAGIATHSVFEFQPSLTAPDLTHLIGR